MIRKNILIRIFVIFTLLFSGLNTVVAENAPSVNCFGLPGCVDKDISKPADPDITNNLGIELATNIIGEVIQFVAIVAIIALVLSGIMYILSGGEEEKVKKAKTWIIWSLVGVFLSLTAWSIIEILNKITIN